MANTVPGGHGGAGVESRSLSTPPQVPPANPVVGSISGRGATRPIFRRRNHVTPKSPVRSRSRARARRARAWRTRRSGIGRQRSRSDATAATRCSSRSLWRDSSTGFELMPSGPPVSNARAVSANVVGTPSTVTSMSGVVDTCRRVRMGAGARVVCSRRPNTRKAESLVSNELLPLMFPFWVKMTASPADTVSGN